MACDAYIQPLYEFLDARIRLKVKPDGTLEGVLGGYQPWYPVYWSHANVGYIDERGFGVDAPALYYALRREADAYPDPKTGQNTAISAAYMIEAVPAFVASLGGSGGAHAAADGPRASRLPDRSMRHRRGSRGDVHGLHGGRASALTRAIERLFGAAEPASPGAQAVARRLSPDQYRRVIADVFGPAIKIEGRFEPELRDSGLFGSRRRPCRRDRRAGWSSIDAMARGIAAQVVSEEHRGTLIPCTPRTPRARRPTTPARRVSSPRPRARCCIGVPPGTGRKQSGIVTLAGSMPRPQDVLAGHYLFRPRDESCGHVGVTAISVPRANRPKPDPLHVRHTIRLDALSSKASQLSFFLWDAGPDPKLIAAAANGKLGTASGLPQWRSTG